jgi:maltose alpha-D-glucosyltransferase/alpha-amylase
MDSVYGSEAVNVEVQSHSPLSLLNWMKRLIAARRSPRTFGRGSLRPTSHFEKRRGTISG